MLVKELMRKEVMSVPADMPLVEVAALFKARCISGAPVVDDAGAVLGVISLTDLVNAGRQDRPTIARFHVQPEPLEEETIATVVVAAPGTAETAMTPGAIAIDENATVAAAAEAMLERHIHRMLVTRGGKLAGIVTTMDMLRALIEKPPTRRRGAAAARRRPKSRRR